MCVGCPKEPSHRDGSFEYPQHMFLFRNKKNNFHLHTLNWGPAQSMLVDSDSCQNLTLDSCICLSYDVTSGSDIPCIKFDKPQDLVNYIVWLHFEMTTILAKS